MEHELAALTLGCSSGSAYGSLALKPEHFGIEAHRFLWEALQGCPDGVMRRPQLERNLHKLGANVDVCLGVHDSALARAPSADPAGVAKACRDGWLQRSARGETAMLLANRSLTSRELLAGLADISGKYIAETENGCKTWAGIDVLDSRSMLSGVPMGLGLDEFVPGGMPLGKVTCLFGESGMLKSTLAANIIDNVVAKGFQVMLATLEDSSEHTAAARISRVSGVPLAKIITGQLDTDEKQRIADTQRFDAAHASKVHVTEWRGSFREVAAMAKMLGMSHGVSVVIVDYVDLLDKRRGPEGIAEVFREAQMAARDNNQAIVLINQVTRAHMVERGSFRPLMTDMFGSSATYKAPKLAIGSYIPSRYEPVPEDSKLKAIYDMDPERYKNIVELWIQKNQLGKVGVRKLVEWSPATGAMVPFVHGAASTRVLRSVTSGP